MPKMQISRKDAKERFEKKTGKRQGQIEKKEKNRYFRQHPAYKGGKIFIQGGSKSNDINSYRIVNDVQHSI